MRTARPTKAPAYPWQMLAFATVLVAFAVGMHFASPWGNPPWYAFVLVAVLFGLSYGVLASAVEQGGLKFTVSLDEVIIFSALILSPGAWMGPAVLVGTMLAMLWRRNRDAVKVVVNCAMTVAESLVAVYVTFALGGGLVAALIGMFCYWALNLVIISSITFLVMPARRRSFLSLPTIGASFFHAVANTSLGAMAAVVLREEPWAAVGLAGPAAALAMAYRSVGVNATRVLVLESLLDAQQELGPAVREEYAQVILTTLSGLLGGRFEDVQMFVLRGSSDPLHIVLDRTSGRARVSVAAPHELDHAWIVRAASAESAARVELTGTHTHFTLRLGPAGEPLAVLVASTTRDLGRNSNVEGQSRRELLALAERAEKWLLSGDADADSADLPARQLSALRSAAYRLVESASRGVEGRHEMIAELHRVELATTALLGAGTDDVTDPRADRRPQWEQRLPSSVVIPGDLAAAAAASTGDWVVLPAAERASA